MDDPFENCSHPKDEVIQIMPGIYFCEVCKKRIKPPGTSKEIWEEGPVYDIKLTWKQRIKKWLKVI